MKGPEGGFRDTCRTDDMDAPRAGQQLRSGACRRRGREVAYLPEDMARPPRRTGSASQRRGASDPTLVRASPSNRSREQRYE